MLSTPTPSRLTGVASWTSAVPPHLDTSSCEGPPFAAARRQLIRQCARGTRSALRSDRAAPHRRTSTSSSPSMQAAAARGRPSSTPSAGSSPSTSANTDAGGTHKPAIGRTGVGPQTTMMRTSQQVRHRHASPRIGRTRETDDASSLCNRGPLRTYPAGIKRRPQIPDGPDRITITREVHRGHPRRSPSPKGQINGRSPRGASTSGCGDQQSAAHRCPSMAVPAAHREQWLQVKQSTYMRFQKQHR